MEGDGFSDPRRRAARRPRGGARGRGRGKDQHHRRGSQKRTAPKNKPRSVPDLASNEDRFRPIEDEDEENAYDAGVDFDEAASQSMYDPTANKDLRHEVNLSKELSADFSMLESVLASVPLWVRLGEHTRFALGIPDEDKIEDYLDPLPPNHGITSEISEAKNEPSDEFLQDLAGLSFEDDDPVTEGGQSHNKAPLSNEIQPGKDREGISDVSPGQNVQQALATSQPEDPDDFDKWLDEV